MQISEFMNTRFRGYVSYDNERSLPNLMDGLKITQRKVLHAFIDHIGQAKIVCDKAGMRAADVTKYHHGATSMIDVLVNMNQDFPGANNMPLFQKHGQFGTRLSHEASSPRYISTQLNDTYRKLFEADDRFILTDQFDDGDKIEPAFYLPKLPLLLINGSDGTGNGYKSKVLSYSATDIKEAVMSSLAGSKITNTLVPHYNGYAGTITKDATTGQVTFTGAFTRVNSTTIIITVLPPSMQLAKYKDILNALMEKDKDGNVTIKDYDNESTEDAWRFVIDCPRATTALSDDELLTKFKLVERDTETLVAWLPNGKLRVFKTVEELIETWTELRLGFYETRRLDKLARYAAELDWLSTKLKFINWWNRKASALVKLNKSDLREQIQQHVTTNDGYIDRLTSIRISNLGLDEVTALEAEIAQINAAYAALDATTNKKIMTAELKAIKL